MKALQCSESNYCLFIKPPARPAASEGTHSSRLVSAAAGGHAACECYETYDCTEDGSRKTEGFPPGAT